MKKLAFLLSIALIIMPFMLALGNGMYTGEEDPASDADGNTPHLSLSPVHYSSLVLAPDAKNVSYPARGLMLLVTPNLSQVYNSDIYGDDSWNAKGKIGFNFELSYFTKLGRIVSIGAGIGYSSFKSEVTLDSSYREIPLTEDHDGHMVTKYIRTDPITESMSVGCIDIPLYIEFGNPNVDQIGFYGRVGLKVSFPISSKLSGEGTYTSWGDYPDCPVMLEDIPELGYYNINRFIMGRKNQP